MSSRSETWVPSTLRNLVYETIVKRTKNGQTPITESDLMLYLENEGLKASRREIVNILMELETHGYVRVKSSGEEERLIIYTGR
ncbi:hypothetical protein APE_2473a [Aeropyrum pernix K1]|uniref:Uncharacterized protein n=1 Tax=Aeropyrum pernix (strain ATCC 700893 / DSM 11879 / JCM 9820 / NBRC 100138 / K1) TaxID=272557 RepID=Q05DW8_AERPE|nr:hypothetical protein [Aeropyrum pernix]BAF34833.1 hypothetical protein APE_2473a [Aeropyrum pernix K1]